MDLGTLIRILVKRWYVVIPMLAVTLATAVQIGRSMEPTFQANGAVLLIGPNTSGDEEVNPLAELRSPLNTTALAVALIAADQQTRSEVRALGFEGTYSVDVTPNTPIINIRVRADTPEQALLTLEATIEAVGLELDERQRGLDAPESTLIQAEVLTRTTIARALYGSRDRAVSVIIGLGLLASASAAIVADNWARRRQQKARTVSGTQAGHAMSNDFDDDPGNSSGVTASVAEGTELDDKSDLVGSASHVNGSAVESPAMSGSVVSVRKRRRWRPRRRRSFERADNIELDQVSSSVGHPVRSPSFLPTSVESGDEPTSLTDETKEEPSNLDTGNGDTRTGFLRDEAHLDLILDGLMFDAEHRKTTNEPGVEPPAFD